MTTHDVEAFVDAHLTHAYDPNKAREYYLRTRELKGRLKGQVEVKKPRVSAQPIDGATKHKSNALRLKKIAEARVAQLKSRLAKLEKILEKLTAQAKERSGADPQKSSASPKSKANEKDSKDAKPLTGSQKRDAAKRAEKSREKDGDPSLPAEAKQLEAKIKKIRDGIIKMKAQLAAAKQKAGSNSKTGVERPLTHSEERR